MPTLDHSYTTGYPDRMKTAISIPDDLFDAAENRLAPPRMWEPPPGSVGEDADAVRTRGVMRPWPEETSRGGSGRGTSIADAVA